jgi:hypothetical protein
MSPLLYGKTIQLYGMGIHYEYDHVGGATDDDADELLVFVQELKSEVAVWLKEYHTDLL